MTDSAARWLALRQGPLAGLLFPVDHSRMSEEYGSVVSLARDAIARPHDALALDRLRMECGVFADQLRQVMLDEGDAAFLADALLAIVLDRARVNS